VAGASGLGLAAADDAPGDPVTLGAPLGVRPASVGPVADDDDAAGLGLGEVDDEDAPSSPNGPAATTATIATSTRPATIRPRTAGLCHRIDERAARSSS
jgi:hypothetical protein